MNGWIFLGDAHLNPYRKDFTWDAFRRLVADPPEGLVLMGDFFDFWFGFSDNTHLESLYGDIREAFERLGEGGTRIIFLEGNHDFCLSGEIFGIRVENHRWEVSLQLDGLRLYLSHGDRASGFPHNLPCILLKNRILCSLLSLLGPKVITPLAFLWAARSRRCPADGRLKERLRSFALQKLREGVDVVIMAHTHDPEAVQWELQGRKGLYFNVGSFREGDYLLFSGGRFALKKFKDGLP